MNMNTGFGWFYFLLIIGGIGLFLFLYFKFFKLFKIKNIVFVDGGLGTGKSFYSVYLAIRLYRRSLRRYKIAKVILKALSFIPKFKEKYSSIEEPILYSNIRLRNIKFTRLTKDLLFRINYRFAYGSVILIDECSLMADQYIFKDRIAAERLTNFFKLIRHQLKGGYLIVNSQSISDLPYPLKYVLSDYLYIHHKSNWPFFSSLACQEMAYNADPSGANIVNARVHDIEEGLRIILVPKRYYKYYDTYCYSIFTDMLPVYRMDEYNVKGDSLKSGVLLSFKEYKFLTENLDKMKEGEKK